jgi:hypothetical protein
MPCLLVHGYHIPIYTASYPRRIISFAIPLWESQILPLLPLQHTGTGYLNSLGRLAGYVAIVGLYLEGALWRIQTGTSVVFFRPFGKCLHGTRWFKYDRDYLCVNKSHFFPVIFEPPCTWIRVGQLPYKSFSVHHWCIVLYRTLHHLRYWQ